MHFSKKKTVVLLLLLLLISAAAIAIVKRRGIWWHLRMYLSKDVTNFSVRLPDSIKETSGLIFWQKRLWTMNDHKQPFLYGINAKTGIVERKVKLIGVNAYDWEDLTQDDQYVYIGDFGDNELFERKIKRTIYKVDKKAMEENDSVTVEKINFTVEGYYNDRKGLPNHTNFDFEAMIARNDSLYLFTKEWINQQTTIYVLPKKTGHWLARKRESYFVDGLITGATFFASTNTLALCGYNTDMKTYLMPFVIVFSGFKGDDFFSGEKRKVFLGKPFHQVEGIATNNGKNFFFTNEGLSKENIVFHSLLMSANLEKYIPKTN